MSIGQTCRKAITHPLEVPDIRVVRDAQDLDGNPQRRVCGRSLGGQCGLSYIPKGTLGSVVQQRFFKAKPLGVDGVNWFERV